jgi:hypothetical protein
MRGDWVIAISPRGGAHQNGRQKIERGILAEQGDLAGNWHNSLGLYREGMSRRFASDERRLFGVLLSMQFRPLLGPYDAVTWSRTPADCRRVRSAVPKKQRIKNDARDAEAVLTALHTPGMRFVTIKTEEQQKRLAWHRRRPTVGQKNPGSENWTASKRTLPTDN